MTVPSENLAGMTLAGGWRVIAARTFGPTHSGGGFSTGYDVEDQNGRQGFLKAINLSPALQAQDVLQELAILIEGVNHERFLLDECKKNGLHRIATTIHEETLPMGQPGFPVPVPCFVFDAADYDIRDFLALQKSLDHARAFFLLHQTTLALHDLHSIGIAHQDLKPSNVLMFGTDGIKIADLGRSSKLGRLSLIDGLPVAGDRGYSPPELLYGYILPDWNARRFGTDLYMLGGLVTFFVAQQSVTSMILSKLPVGLKPGQCDFQTVLPIWRHEFATVLDQIESQLTPDLDQRTVRGIISTIEYLCEPEAELRGHPGERSPNLLQHDLRRFVAEFSFLSKRIDLQITSGN